MGADSGKYEQLGVDPSKKDVHTATAGLGKGLVEKAFCKLEMDLMDDPTYGSIMHGDGAGSKAALAYAYYKETGDLSVWAGIAQDSILMNLDDVTCVGATGPFILSSAIARNSRKVSAGVLKALMEGEQAFCANMAKHRIDIRSGGGETADLNDQVATLVVDHTLFTRVLLDQVIDNARIKAGDVIVGLASFGQATYENAYNSGIGSNGLTLARHGLFHSDIGLKYPETWDRELGLYRHNPPEALAYRGQYKLTDPLPGTPLDVGRAVLSPTRTYAPIVKEIFENIGHRAISGMIHCSGGGQTKVLRFLNHGLRAVKNNMFDTPPLFDAIQQESGTDWKEMYKVFNMGHRMELYVRSTDVAEEIIAVSRSFGVDAQIIGHVEASLDGSQVYVETKEHGRFVYE